MGRDCDGACLLNCSSFWESLIFCLTSRKISGGTGITPFYQLLDQLVFSRPKVSMTRFTLLHSSRIPSELPPPEILQPLVSKARDAPDRLRISLFVDTLNGSGVNAIQDSQDLQEGFIDKAAIHRALGPGNNGTSWWQRLFGRASSKPAQLPGRKILFLVCGPEP